MWWWAAGCPERASGAEAITVRLWCSDDAAASGMGSVPVTEGLATMTRTDFCRSKRRYASKAAVQAVLVEAVMRWNRGSWNRRERRVYHCPGCHGWHLTSQQSEC